MDKGVLINALAELARAEEDLVAARLTQARSRDRNHSGRELQEEYEQDAADAAVRGKSSADRFRRRNQELEQVEERLAERRKRFAAVQDPRQADALKAEIAHLMERRDELETRALELLDEAGEDQQEVEAVRLEAEQTRLRREQKDRKLHEAADRARDGEAELADEIERLLTLLPDDVARHVRRLRTRLDQSTVFLVHGACGGCFGQLPAQQAISVESGRELIQCASCSRYVVHRPWR